MDGMAIGDYNDPLEAAKRRSRFTLPAVSQFGPSGITAGIGYEPFRRMGRTVSQNQVPIGGFGLGALSNVGYSRGNASDIFGGQQNSSPQIPSGFKGYVSPEDAVSKGLQWTGAPTGWQPYVSPEQAKDQNLMYTGGPSAFSVSSGSDQTTHFLPPGFTSTTGSTGVSGSTQQDIHFLPPGFTSVQGVTNPGNKQLQAPQGQGGSQFSGFPSILEEIQRIQRMQGGGGY